MGFFKNAIVKGLAGGAGALTLAVTKNPALAATASQLVNQHGHKLVDPAVKLLANHKFSFGKHKFSARDILHKVRKVKEMIKGGGIEPYKRDERDFPDWDQNWTYIAKAAYDDNPAKVRAEYKKLIKRGDDAEYNKIVQNNGWLIRPIFDRLAAEKGLLGGGGESEGGLDVSGVRNKLARSGAMVVHDQLSRLGRNNQGYRFQNN